MNALALLLVLTVYPLDLRGAPFVAAAKQAEVLTDFMSDLIVYAGGIASGKTETGAKWVIRRAAECPGGRLLVCAPTYPMLKDAAWPMLEASVPREIVERSVKFEMTIRAGPEPLTVIGKNLSKPATLQGINADAGAWIDEGSVITRAGYEEIQRRTRAVRRPWKPQTLITSNTSGHNWLWEVAKERPLPGTHLVETTTYEMEPYLGVEFIARLEASFSEKTRKRWLGGSWDDFTGGVYDAFDPARHVIPPPDAWKDGRAPAEWRRLGGIDFGWDDAFAYEHLVRAPGERPVYYVVGEHYRAGAHLDTHAAAIRALWDEVRPTLWSEHEKQSRMELQRLLKATLHPADKGLGRIDALQARIDLINRLFAGGQLYILRGAAPNLVRELQEREYYEDPHPKKGRPKDEKNHATDALEYAVFSDWQRGGVRFTRPTFVG